MQISKQFFKTITRYVRKMRQICCKIEYSFDTEIFSFMQWHLKKKIRVDTILIILILITHYQHMFLQSSPTEQYSTYRKDFKRSTVNPNNTKLFSITTKTLWYFVSTSTALWHTGSFGKNPDFQVLMRRDLLDITLH